MSFLSTHTTTSSAFPPAAATLNEFLAQGGTAEGGCGAPLDGFSVKPDQSSGTCPEFITRRYNVSSCGVESFC